MDWIEGLILGIIQGLTEFLPVSSSGHLELGKRILGVEVSDSMQFSIITHGATVLSTLVVFRKDIWSLLKGLFSFKWNEETQFILKIVLSSLPILLVALLFEDAIDALFEGHILWVGCALLLTSALLAFTHFKKDGDRPISYWDSLLIGCAQAFAIIPGISRSGATIASSILLGNKRSEAARFSFLMVLLPILGKNFLDLIGGDTSEGEGAGIATGVLVVGAIAAFLAGWVACRFMIKLVTRSKLSYFAIYCGVVGLLAIILSFV